MTDFLANNASNLSHINGCFHTYRISYLCRQIVMPWQQQNIQYCTQKLLPVFYISRGSVADPVPSVCFWAGSGSVFMRYGSVFGSESFNPQAKIVRKNRDSYTVLWLLYDLLSLKNDVNVATKSSKQEKRRKK